MTLSILLNLSLLGTGYMTWKHLRYLEVRDDSVASAKDLPSSLLKRGEKRMKSPKKVQFCLDVKSDVDIKSSNAAVVSINSNGSQRSILLKCWVVLGLLMWIRRTILHFSNDAKIITTTALVYLHSVMLNDFAWIWNKNATMLQPPPYWNTISSCLSSLQLFVQSLILKEKQRKKIIQFTTNIIKSKYPFMMNAFSVLISMSNRFANENKEEDNADIRHKNLEQNEETKKREENNDANCDTKVSNVAKEPDGMTRDIEEYCINDRRRKRSKNGKGAFNIKDIDYNNSNTTIVELEDKENNGIGINKV